MALSHKNYNPDLFYGATQGEDKLAVTQGSLIIGDASGVGAELNVSTNAQIIVGNGTTATSVAVSGDVGITNAGVATVTNVTGATGTTALETVTATNVITAAESGTVFVLSSATEFASTLPAPASGLRYRFVIGAAPSGASYTVVTNSGDNVIQGLAVVNGATVPAVSEDTITFTDGAAAVGDWVEVVSDGTSWFVAGQGGAATAIAFTAT